MGIESYSFLGSFLMSARFCWRFWGSFWDVGIYIVQKCQKGTEIDEKVEQTTTDF